jgi:hypothetical protein
MHGEDQHLGLGSGRADGTCRLDAGRLDAVYDGEPIVQDDDVRAEVERKWERNGEYKEERKCRGGRRAYPAYGYRY